MLIFLLGGLFHRAGHWRGPHIHPVLQGDVVEDAAGQDDVAGLLRGVLQCPLGSIQAAESGAERSEGLLNHTVSCRMGHVIAIFSWSFRNVKWGHEPGAEKEGTVTCGEGPKKSQMFITGLQTKKEVKVEPFLRCPIPGYIPLERLGLPCARQGTREHRSEEDAIPVPKSLVQWDQKQVNRHLCHQSVQGPLRVKPTSGNQGRLDWWVSQ